MNSFYSRPASIACTTLVMLVASAASLAQEVLPFNITAQPLVEALKLFADQARMQLLYKHDAIEGADANAVVGSFEKHAALDLLLQGTGLEVVFTADDAATLRQKRRASVSGQGGMIKSSDLDERYRANSLGTRLAQADASRSAAVPATAANEGSSEEPISEVLVRGAKRKFAPTDSSVATKIPMDVIDTPQALSTLSSELLNIVAVRNLSSALALTPGTLEKRGDTAPYFDVVVRGFKVDLYNRFKINGLSFVDEGGPIDLGLAERVEIARGPTSIIYGQSDYGATINVQLKKPRVERAVLGELSGNAYGGYRSLIDATGTLTGDERLRGRLISIYDNSETAQNLAYSRSTTVAPSLSFDLADSTTLDLQLFHTRRNFRHSGGFPLVQDSVTGELSLPEVPKSAFLSADFNDSSAHTTYGTAELTHEFAQSWVLTVAGNRYETDADVINSFILGPVPESGDATLYDSQFNAYVDDTSVDVSLRGEFHALGHTHTLLLNGYHRDYKENFFESVRAPIGTINIFHPVSRGFSRGLDLARNVEHSPQSPDIDYNTHFVMRDSALSALLLLHPSDRLSVMLGLRNNRHRRIDADFYDRSQSERFKDSAITERIGLVYKLRERFNVYGSFSNGVIFQPNATVSGRNLTPETGVQYEVGAKTSLLNDKLQFAVAAFEIERQNVAVHDPDTDISSPFSIAVDGQTHKGIELEAVGEPAPGWNILSSYSYLDISIRNTPDQGMNGHQLSGSPHHMFNLYSTYQLLSGKLKGLSFGGGVFHASKREVNDFGTFQMPAYTRFDLRLGYDAFENASFAINATNITDADIYTTQFNGRRGFMDYLNRRTVSFNVNYRFQ